MPMMRKETTVERAARERREAKEPWRKESHVVVETPCAPPPQTRRERLFGRRRRTTLTYAERVERGLIYSK